MLAGHYRKKKNQAYGFIKASKGGLIPNVRVGTMRRKRY